MECTSCQELVDEVEQLYGTLENLEQNNEDLTNQNQQLDLQLSTVQENFSEERHSLTQRISRLETELSSLHNAQQTDCLLRKQLAEVTQELSDAVDTVTTLSQQLEDEAKSKNKLQDQYKDALSEIDSLHSNIASLKAQQTSGQGDNVKLVNILRLKDEEIANGNQKITEMTDEISRLIELNNDLVDQVESAEDAKQAISLENASELSRLRLRITELNQLIKRLQQDLENKDIVEDKDLYERKLESLQEVINQLEGQNEELNITIENQSEQIEFLIHDIDRLKHTDLESKSSGLSISDLHQMVSNLEQELLHKDDLIVVYREEASQIATEKGLQTLLKDLDELRDQVINREEEIRFLQAKINDFEFFIRKSGLAYSKEILQQLKSVEDEAQMLRNAHETRGKRTVLTKTVGIESMPPIPTLSASTQSDWIDNSQSEVKVTEHKSTITVVRMPEQASVDVMAVVECKDQSVGSDFDEPGNMDMILNQLDILDFKFSSFFNSLDNMDAVTATLQHRFELNSGIVAFLKQLLLQKDQNDCLNNVTIQTLRENSNNLTFEKLTEIELLISKSLETCSLLAQISPIVELLQGHKSKINSKIHKKDVETLVELVNKLSSEQVTLKEQLQQSISKEELADIQNELDQSKEEIRRLQSENARVSSDLALASSQSSFLIGQLKEIDPNYSYEAVFDELSLLYTQLEDSKARVIDLERQNLNLLQNFELKTPSLMEVQSLFMKLLDFLFVLSLSVTATANALSHSPAIDQSGQNHVDDSDSDDDVIEMKSSRATTLQLISIRQEKKLIKSQLKSLLHTVALQENALSEALKNLNIVEILAEMAEHLRNPSEHEFNQHHSDDTLISTQSAPTQSFTQLQSNCKNCQSLSRIVASKSESIDQLSQLLEQTRVDQKIRVGLLLSDSNRNSLSESKLATQKEHLTSNYGKEFETFSEQLLRERNQQLSSMSTEYQYVQKENLKLKEILASRASEISNLQQKVYVLQNHSEAVSSDRVVNQLKSQLIEKETEVGELKKAVNRLLKKLKKVKPLT
ncbi:hypothetical protein GEMRC1_011027 [Eukaryota sp. GEM-RC1]